MRLAVIGRGKWGMNIVRTLATMRDMELIDESKNFGVVLRQQPAGVLIATPSATHAEVALPFIDAGVPTFIEKPMATTVADAIRIHKAALRSGVTRFRGTRAFVQPRVSGAKKFLPEVGTVQAVFWEGMNRPSDESIHRCCGTGFRTVSPWRRCYSTQIQFRAGLGHRRSVAVQGGKRQIRDC